MLIHIDKTKMLYLLNEPCLTFWCEDALVKIESRPSVAHFLINNAIKDPGGVSQYLLIYYWVLFKTVFVQNFTLLTYIFAISIHNWVVLHYLFGHILQFIMRLQNLLEFL